MSSRRGVFIALKLELSYHTPSLLGLRNFWALFPLHVTTLSLKSMNNTFMFCTTLCAVIACFHP